MQPERPIQKPLGSLTPSEFSRPKKKKRFQLLAGIV